MNFVRNNESLFSNVGQLKQIILFFRHINDLTSYIFPVLRCRLTGTARHLRTLSFLPDLLFQLHPNTPPTPVMQLSSKHFFPSVCSHCKLNTSLLPIPTWVQVAERIYSPKKKGVVEEKAHFVSCFRKIPSLGVS